MSMIRIAQIGMNRYSHASEIFTTMKLHPEVFDLVGYAVVEDERETCADKIKKYFAGYEELSVEEILNDPTIEAVAVETDEIHLLKYAQMAADAGKHIHMEKPGSQNLQDFERLIETVRRTGKILHLGYMYRYNPIIADAIHRVKAGEFGTVYSVEAHMSRLDNKKAREWFGSFQGGMMFYLGCHLVDLVMQIQGVPEQVIPLNTATGLDGVDTEDLGFAVLRYPNGISMVRMGGAEVGGFNRRQLVICGSKRTAEIKPLENLVKNADRQYMLYTEKNEAYIGENGRVVRKYSRSEDFQRYEDMLLSFGQMVRGEKKNPFTPEYELALFRVLMQCCGIESDGCRKSNK